MRPVFSNFFLNKLLARVNHIDDLYTLDPELYKNLMSLKDIVRGGGDLEELALSFTITTTMYGSYQQTPLMPGGVDTPVTNSNYFRYIAAIANHKLNRCRVVEGCVLKTERFLLPLFVPPPSSLS